MALRDNTRPEKEINWFMLANRLDLSQVLKTLIPISSGLHDWNSMTPKESAEANSNSYHPNVKPQNCFPVVFSNRKAKFQRRIKQTKLKVRLRAPSVSKYVAVHPFKPEQCFKNQNEGSWLCDEISKRGNYCEKFNLKLESWTDDKSKAT